MELSVTDLRIILDALECKFTALAQAQAQLDDSQTDRIAEFSNDLYYLEFLIDCLKDDYQQRVLRMTLASRPSFGESGSTSHQSAVALHVKRLERELA